MANSLSVKVEVDGPTLRRLVRTLKKEADGKALARDLVTQLKVIGQPALAAVKGSIAEPFVSKSDRPRHQQPGLRAAIAKQTKLSVRTSGRHPGITILVRKTGMPRGFKNAPKYVQSPKGWRHPVFGVWQKGTKNQVGHPGWFDDTLRPFREPAKKAAGDALEAVARRISEGART